MLKKLVTGLFDRAGYAVIAKWRLFHDPQVKYLRRLFDLTGVDCVIDVGANNGQFVHFLRVELGYHGHVISFEPNPVAAEQARKAAAGDLKWSVHEMALGREAGVATLNVMKFDVYSSLLPPSDTLPAIDHVEYGMTVDRTVEVEVKTADEVLPGLLAAIGVKRPYLKLDTQGFDLEVVAGATELLKTVVACQTEVPVTQIYAGGGTFDQTLAVFHEAGFAPSGLFPTNDIFPSLIDMDFHLIRKDLLPENGKV
jgi:FkbM family methyltransferase